MQKANPYNLEKNKSVIRRRSNNFESMHVVKVTFRSKRSYCFLILQIIYQLLVNNDGS